MIDAELAKALRDAEASFKLKYETLRTLYEARVSSLGDTVRSLARTVVHDDVTAVLQDNPSTRTFASLHVASLLEDGLQCEREAFIDELANRIANAEAVAAQRRQELAALITRNDELESILSTEQSSDLAAASREHETASLANDVSQLKREYKQALESCTAKADRLRTENAALRRQCADGRQQVQRLEAQLQTVETQSTTLQQTLVTARAGQQQAAQAQLEACQARIEQALAAAAAAQQRADAAELALASSRQECAQLAAQLAAAAEAGRDSEARFKAAAASLQGLVEKESINSAAALRSLKEKAQLSREKLAAEAAAARRTASELSAELASIQRTAELQQQALEDQLRRSQAALAAEQQERALQAKRLDAQQSTLLERLAAVEHELQTARDASSASSSTTAATAAAAVAALTQSLDADSWRRQQRSSADVIATQALSLAALHSADDSSMRSASLSPMRAAAAAAAAPAAVAVSSGSRDDAPSKLQLADKLEEAAVNIGHLRQLLVQETAAHTEAARSAAEAQHELDRYQRVPIRTRNTTLKYCRHDEILLARSQCSVI
jgi:trimeric autotransporter adhesin